MFLSAGQVGPTGPNAGAERRINVEPELGTPHRLGDLNFRNVPLETYLMRVGQGAALPMGNVGNTQVFNRITAIENNLSTNPFAQNTAFARPPGAMNSNSVGSIQDNEELLLAWKQQDSHQFTYLDNRTAVRITPYFPAGDIHYPHIAATIGGDEKQVDLDIPLIQFWGLPEELQDELLHFQRVQWENYKAQEPGAFDPRALRGRVHDQAKKITQATIQKVEKISLRPTLELLQQLVTAEQKKSAAYIEISKELSFRHFAALDATRFADGAPLPPPSPERIPPEEKAKRKKLELPPAELKDLSRPEKITTELALPEKQKNDKLKDPEDEGRAEIGDADENRAIIGDPEMDGPQKKSAAGRADPNNDFTKFIEEEGSFSGDKAKQYARITLIVALAQLTNTIFKPESEKPGKTPTQAQTNRALNNAIKQTYPVDGRGNYLTEPPTAWLQTNFYAYVQQNAAELGLVGRKNVAADVVVEPTPQENPAVQAWLAKRAERGERSLPQVDLEAAKRNRAAPIQTLIGAAAGPASAVRLLTMEDFQAALGEQIFGELQSYFAGQNNNTLFDFTLHYFRLFFHRHPEIFGHPELLATQEIDQSIIADIFTHVERAHELFNENIVREFGELFQLAINDTAAEPAHAELFAATVAQSGTSTVTIRNYLPYPQDAATQALGLGGFLRQLPGFSEKEVRELFQAEVGRAQNTVFEWGSVRTRKIDGLPDRDFEAIRAMRTARGEAVPTEKAHVDAAMWDEYTSHLRELGHLEYATVHPSNDSLGTVFNVYTFAREYAQAQGLDIDFFDFLCALSPPFRRMRERSRTEDRHQTVYLAVPSFMRELPFANWGYSTWAQLFEQRSIASHVLPATVHQHATGGTEFPEYQTLGHYTARINDEHESAYNFAASLMRWAFLFDSGLEVWDVSGTPVTQTNTDETPSRFRIQLVDDPSEIPEGGDAIVSGSRLAIRHDAQRGVYRNRLEFVGNYLAAIALLPGTISLRDHNGQTVELQLLRDQLERLREQERISSTVLSDRNPELAATRSHQNLENIFQFYRDLHQFIDQTLFFTAARGEVETARGPIPFRSTADVSNIRRDDFTWSGDTVAVVDDLPAAVARGHWSTQDIGDLLQCRVLVAFLRGINEFPQANGIPNEAEVVAALQPHWHGSSATLATAAQRYVQLEQVRRERAQIFDESSTAPKPTGGRRTQQIFGPVLPARRFAGTWQEQFIDFAIATAGMSTELAATGQVVLEEYFRTVPASVTHFWPVALERIIATHVPVASDREPLSRTIVAFLPRVGVANEVVSRQLDPSRKLEDQIGEWAKTDYIALFPVREGLEGSKVPVENALIDELIDHTMEQHAGGRALRRRDIRAYVVRELGLYNQGRPEPNRDLGAANLLLADHGHASERLNLFCARWEAQHAGIALDQAVIRRGYQSLAERVLLGEAISPAQIQQSLGTVNNPQNVEALQTFIAQQTQDLQTLQTYIGTQGAGIDAYVRQQFRNTDYVNADGLIALATHHARRVLATDGAIDIAAIALDAVDPSFEPYRSIADRMAVSYQALYRHFAHNLARHFTSQVELVQTAIATVSDDIQNRQIEIPATREAFETEVFGLATIANTEELAELNQHHNLLQTIVGADAAIDLNQELNNAYADVEAFSEHRNTQRAEIQAAFAATEASVLATAARVQAALPNLLAIEALPADADLTLAQAHAGETAEALQQATNLQRELEQSRDTEIIVLTRLYGEAHDLGLDLGGRLIAAQGELAHTEEQLAGARAYVQNIHDAADFRIAELEDEAETTEKIAKAREAAAQVEQEFTAIEADVENELGVVEDYLRLLPQNHQKIMAAMQRRALQKNIPLEEFDGLMDQVVDFNRDATLFAEHELSRLDQRLTEFQSLNARVEKTLQDLPEQDRAAFGATYFSIHALFIRLTELRSSDVHPEDMVNMQYKILLQLEQNVEIPTTTVVAVAGPLPALVESDVRVGREGLQEITNRFRETEASGSFAESRRTLQDFLDAEVSNEGSPSVLISRQTAEQIRAWKNAGRAGDLSIYDIFGQKRDLPAYMMPLAVLTREQLPENHPYTRLLTAMGHLLSHGSNEARLVAELRKHPHLFNQIARLFAHSEPPINSNEQARLLVRRYAVSHIVPILDALSEGNAAKRQRIVDRYFVIEKKPLQSANPAAATPAAAIVLTAEQIRVTLPTDLADLLPAENFFRLSVEEIIDRVAALDITTMQAPSVVAKAAIGGHALQKQADALIYSSTYIDILAVFHVLDPTGNLAKEVEKQQAASTPEVDLRCIRGLYGEVVARRDKVLAAVAAHRAANPDANDPHPEMLPWSDYGVNTMGLDEISDRLVQTGLVPSSSQERLALAQSLSMFNFDLDDTEGTTFLLQLVAKLTGCGPAVKRQLVNPARGTDNLTPQEIFMAARGAYRAILENRSRIIAEVVHREEKAKAEAAQKAAAVSTSTAQAAPTLNLPTDLADLLPSELNSPLEATKEIVTLANSIGMLPWDHSKGSLAEAVCSRFGLQKEMGEYFSDARQSTTDGNTVIINLYKLLSKSRAKILTAVAAHRAANPGNDPHQEMLPWSDYAGVDKMTEAEITDRIQQTRLIPTTQAERIALARSLELEITDNALADVNISSSTLFLMLIKVLNLEAIQKAIAPYVPTLMQAQATDNRQQIRTINLSMSQAAYRALLSNRSRIIAEVVKREAAGEAMSQQPAAVVAPATSVAPVQSTPQPRTFSESAKLLPKRGIQDPTLRNDIRKLFEAFQEVTPNLEYSPEMQAALTRAQEIGQRLKQRVEQRLQVSRAVYNTERAQLARIYESQSLEEICFLLNMIDPAKRLGDAVLNREFALEREHFPSRPATNRGEIPSQALGRAYLVLLEHRDELIKLLEEKRAEILAAQATPAADQAVNSGLTFGGAKPDSVIAQPPIPPLSK